MGAMSVPASSGASANAEREALLAETRRRAASIDSYVDMIPARFYLGTEIQANHQASGLDPAKFKPTSQLVAEAALATAAASNSSPSSKKKDRRKDKEGDGASGGDARGDNGARSGSANSRTELRAKLEQRIGELREERKRKQSAEDKLKVKKEEKKGKGKLDATSSKEKEKGEDEDDADVEDMDDADVETGKLTFDPRGAQLPFEAGVNRRGTKVRRLRAALRGEEANRRKVGEADSEADGEDKRGELKRDLAMTKALKRAKGEKVHDDATKLRKAQKSLEMRRKKGKDKWSARVDSEHKQQDQIQSRRKENLKSRRGSKKKGKRAGFEGKHSGNLNDG